MSALLNRYFFRFTHNGNERTANPTNEDVSFVDNKVDGQIFRTREIKDTLEATGADFVWFLAINNSAERCLPIILDVFKRVQGGSPTLAYTGQFYAEDCEWDENKCTVQIKCKAQDVYERLTSMWNKEVNIIEGTTKTQVHTSFTDVIDPGTSNPFTVFEYLTTNETINIALSPDEVFTDSTFPDQSQGWVKKSESIAFVVGTFIDYKKTVKWVREVTALTYPVASPPAVGTGWVAASASDPTKYARSLYSVMTSEVYSNFPVTLPDGWDYPLVERRFAYLPEDAKIFENGMSLAVVLDKLLAGMGLTVVSDFYEINPTGIFPAVPEYTDGNRKPNVFFFQRSDILNFSATEPATIANTSLKKVLDILAAKHDTQVTISGTDFILEHRAYYEERQGIDFTASPYNKSLRGTDSYRYQRDATPTGEAYYDEGENASQEFFKRFFFSYEIPENDDDIPPNCIVRSAPVKEVASGVLTDISTMVAQAPAFSEDGLAMLTASEAFGTRVLDTFGYANFFCAAKALSVLYRRQKYFEHGYLESTDAILTFYSVIRYKIQTQITIQLLDYSLFNPIEEQKNQYGWADVVSSEYSLGLGDLTLQLANDV